TANQATGNLGPAVTPAVALSIGVCIPIRVVPAVLIGTPGDRQSVLNNPQAVDLARSSSS
ncbi:MAG: hypothetical protein ACN6OP_24135, partial [Pseudomonadales bacterium]